MGARMTANPVMRLPIVGQRDIGSVTGFQHPVRAPAWFVAVHVGQADIEDQGVGTQAPRIFERTRGVNTYVRAGTAFPMARRCDLCGGNGTDPSARSRSA
jgi:hypothetical protein